MKRLANLSVVLFALGASAAASYSDKYTLATDALFQHRVQQSMIAGCTSVINEAVTVAYHRERALYCTAVLNSPTNFVPLFAALSANDANVIADATASGTVVLTSANIDTQQASVTDAHIDAALAANFNAIVGIEH